MVKIIKIGNINENRRFVCDKCGCEFTCKREDCLKEEHYNSIKRSYIFSIICPCCKNNIFNFESGDVVE